MAALRRNIVRDRRAREGYVSGVGLLKSEDTGITTADLRIPTRPGGRPQLLSTWDLFVVWHVRAMNEQTPPGADRNAAHFGPAFLPWHRWMLVLLEANLQRVLDDADFGLPYWDWAADGDRPLARQPQSRLWADDCMGGDGAGRAGEVASGPFGAASGFRVRIDMDSSGTLLAAERPLRRRFRAVAGFGLPRRADVARCLSLGSYDEAPWDGNAEGFRNALEGWLPSETAPNLHNRVHVWIGGDMGLGTSPNDPVFYLNHCNVDRIWAAWQEGQPNARYRPPDSAPPTLFRHRRSDPLHTFFTDEAESPVRPRDVLRVSSIYTYDTLPPS